MRAILRPRGEARVSRFPAPDSGIWPGWGLIVRDNRVRCERALRADITAGEILCSDAAAAARKWRG